VGLRLRLARFTPENGKITVHTTSQREEKDFFEVEVTDTDIEIAPEDYPNIFVEFSQVDSSHSRKYEGTGLGLALTEKLTEMHGGKIGFESGVGVGSTFRFTLPVNPCIQLGKEPEDICLLKRPAGLETVLVVEDDRKTSELLCIFLNKVFQKFSACTFQKIIPLCTLRLCGELLPFSLDGIARIL